MRRKTRRHSPRRRSNPTLGTGTTLAVIGAVLAGGTLLYAAAASASPRSAAPTPRPTTQPPPPAPAENPAATAAQPGTPATPGNDAPHEDAAPGAEVTDNPVRTDATGAEQRVFPDHVVAILAADTALFTSPSNTDPSRRRIATMRAGQRVNVRLTGDAVRARRTTAGGSFVVSVYGVSVGGAMRDGYAAISRAELPPGTLVTGA